MSCSRAAGGIKKSTGLAQFAVDPAPQHTLAILYGKLLRTLTKIPETAAYRKYTEEIICERIQKLQASKTYEEIEKNICCGQVEELIRQAENELLLARKILIWKAWEPLCKKAPPIQWEWPPPQRSTEKK